MAERIPEQLIDEIIAANDLGEVVGRYVSLKRSGNSLTGLCPFHKEKTPSFHVSTDRQLYYCFGCGAGGNIIGFIKAVENLDYLEAVKLLAENANIAIPETGLSSADRERYEKKQTLYNINKEAAKYYRRCLLSEEGEKAREYIRSRGLSEEMVKLFGIGYAHGGKESAVAFLLEKGFRREDLLLAGIAGRSEDGRIYDRFRARLMFPIIDNRKNILGFGGRILSGEGAKYLNSPETPVFNKRKNLFGLNLAKNSNDGELVLVEGYMDVISLHQYGVKNAVASLGTAFTPEQARLCARYVQQVVLCYDTDEAGVKAADRAIEVFSGSGVRVRILSLPQGKDPDEFVKKNGGEAFKQLAAKAHSVAGYRLSVLEKKHDLESINGKVDFAGEAAKILAQVSNQVERDVYIKKVADITGVAAAAIETETGKSARKNVKKEQKEAVRESVTKAARSSKTPRLLDAERQLISIIAADRGVLARLKEDITSELFTQEIHKKIIDKLLQSGSADAAGLVAEFSEDEAGAAAAALGMPLNFEDNHRAAAGLIETIEEEKHKYLINKAMDEGDVVTLNRLIMEKNKR